MQTVLPDPHEFELEVFHCSLYSHINFVPKMCSKWTRNVYC